tara:strand:+ start:716 stop:904 length:189 start_codon:yes stop_codon:yes gene_type:complete
MYLIELHYPSGEMQIHPAKFNLRIQAEEYVKTLVESKRFDHLTVISESETNTQINTQKEDNK